MVTATAATAAVAVAAADNKSHHCKMGVYAPIFLRQREVLTMIDAVNVPVQTVTVNSPVLFGSTRIKTGCSVRHEEGSGRFILTRPGVYKVTFNAVISAADATVATLNIMQDGEAIAGAQIQVGTGPAPDIESGSVTTLVRVYGCDSTVSVANLGTASLLIENANMVIDRLC